jgi:hypothetical protein
MSCISSKVLLFKGKVQLPCLSSKILLCLVLGAHIYEPGAPPYVLKPHRDSNP